MILIRFYFYTILLFVSVNIVSAWICDQNETDPSIVKKAVDRYPGDCYFVLKDATNDANDIIFFEGRWERINMSGLLPYGFHRKNSRYHPYFEFHINKAYKACCDHHATLPIIRDAFMAKFIKEIFANYSDFYPPDHVDKTYNKTDPVMKGYAVALNVSGDKGTWKWADGTEVEYSPENYWFKVTSRLGAFSYLEAAQADQKTPTAYANILADHGQIVHELPIGVLCHQRKTSMYQKVCSQHFDSLKNKKMINQGNSTKKRNTNHDNSRFFMLVFCLCYRSVIM